MPAVGDGRIGLVETENARLLLPIAAEIQAAVELLRQFGPEADDPPAGIADRPDQPAGKPGVGQEIRGPNLVGRKAVAEQAVPDWLGRGEISRAAVVPASAGRTPAGAGSPGPPARRRRGFRWPPAGPEYGGNRPPSGRRQDARSGLAADSLRKRPWEDWAWPAGRIDHASRAMQDDCSESAGDVKSGVSCRRRNYCRGLH